MAFDYNEQAPTDFAEYLGSLSDHEGMGRPVAQKAYVAIVGQPYTIGVAERDQAGYSPLIDPPGFDTYEEAKVEAEARNEAIGVSKAEAVEIIASSMAAQNRRGR